MSDHQHSSGPARTLPRRRFLTAAGAALGLTSIAGNTHLAAAQRRVAALPDDRLDTWDAIRAQFDLDPDIIQMSGFYLAPHPKPVREAIARHRAGLDANPIGYMHEHQQELEADVRDESARFLDVDADDIALTDSTTMGLGLLYGAIDLKPGQEILTTYHDHYATEISLQHRADLLGTTLRRVRLYDDGVETSVDEIVRRMVEAITPRTRLLAVTWVHSCTGMRLPIGAMAAALAEVNRNRDEGDRVLLSVDGVHGLGCVDATIPDLGCDYFIAGTHKWLFGPRGTGLIWARREAWELARPVIPTFDRLSYGKWMGLAPANIPVPRSHTMTPGGFHSFEHRWAVTDAFRFMSGIGLARAAERIASLNAQMREGLLNIRGVTVMTPMSPDLSAGITCFTVEGIPPNEVVDRLHDRHIIASVTPYAARYVRLAPGLLNDEQQVETCLREVAAIAST